MPIRLLFFIVFLNKASKMYSYKPLDLFVLQVLVSVPVSQFPLLGN